MDYRSFHNERYGQTKALKMWVHMIVGMRDALVPDYKSNKMARITLESARV